MTKLKYPSDPIERFFAFARERQSVYLKRQAGLEKPWTSDPILQKYKFTNIFRENDRTTKWFREWVRDPLKGKPEVLLATVMFRWLTRITTGEQIFCAPDLGGKTLFDRFLQDGDGAALNRGVRKLMPQGPYVTGAYYLSSPKGMGKLVGLCWCMENFWKTPRSYRIGDFNFEETGWEKMAERCLQNPGKISLEEIWAWLKGFKYQGPFHAYEVVTDLRHTSLLDRAPDINTWANLGPGARRGLNRIFRPRKDVKAALSQEEGLEEMRYLLDLSRDPKYWPQSNGAAGLRTESEVFLHNLTPPGEQWPAWEMRESEMWLCENDKMERARKGQGRPRSTYPGGPQ